MPAVFDEETQNFILSSQKTSYVIRLVDQKYLQHVYWGGKVRRLRLDSLSRYPKYAACAPHTKHENFLDVLSQEYPSYGSSDLRSPAFQVMRPDGSTVTELIYKGYQIFDGKKPLEGLPSTYVENDGEAQTLEITLQDDLSGLVVILSYTVYEEYDAIARSVRFTNVGGQQLRLLRVLSANVDFFGSDFELLQLSGAWARERHVYRRKLVPGNQSVESRRGASSHQHNPFIALLAAGATEEKGDVYGFNLVYSGNFYAGVEVDPYDTSRVQVGINPFEFGWLLESGESFQAPEVVMAYSPDGLGGMSRIYHRLYRQRLCRGSYRDGGRPILINNWEATYFNFSEEKLLTLAQEAKALGIELFVLDDGWFGHRDDDHTSLGDWFVHRKKLPNGLKPLAEQINTLGLRFGLWFEPEMISPDSELYRAHPDWCLHVPDRECSLSRHQLVLDLSRREVCDAIIGAMKKILSDVPIRYVKWDFNRNLTEIGSAALPPERQREVAHRYVLGLYYMMESLTAAYPDILFEGCAAGGGRFDPGILAYMPQIWTSDDTDAMERVYIQYATSIVYPASSMGAHVSAVPNHQIERVTPLSTRGNCAMSGNLGYELDVTKMTQEEKSAIAAQTQGYRAIRQTVQFGEMYGLADPFATDCGAWMFVAEDRSQAVVFCFIKLREPNAPCRALRLRGLDPASDYRVDGGETVCGGDELMNAGLIVSVPKGDFQSVRYILQRVD